MDLAPPCSAVRAYWNQHLAAACDYWQLLWNVLVFRQWKTRWESDHTCHDACRPAAAGPLFVSDTSRCAAERDGAGEARSDPTASRAL